MYFFFSFVRRSWLTRLLGKLVEDLHTESQIMFHILQGEEKKKRGEEK